MKFIWNLICYSGLTKEEFKNIAPSVREDNRKELFVFSLLGALAFLVPVIIGLARDNPFLYGMYIALFTVFLLMAIICFVFAKMLNFLVDILVVTYIAILLFGGLAIGIIQKTERTTLLLAFYMSAAIIFTIRLGDILCLLTITQISYIFHAVATQDQNVLAQNIINTSIFYFLGIASAIFLIRLKCKKHMLNYKNSYLADRDELTGLYNRRYFGNDFDAVIAKKIDVSLCVFDVNGLKRVNDNFGHEAGDELIVGAAECILDIFGSYGKIYRTGGDEFSAILDKPISVDEVLKTFDERTSRWTGKIMSELTISVGIAKWDSKSGKKLTDVLNEADVLMYKNKEEQYAKLGLDRRRY